MTFQKGEAYDARNAAVVHGKGYATELKEQKAPQPAETALRPV